MNEISGYIVQIYQNLNNSELFWLVTFICSVIFILLAWLAFRKFRLWYWKVDLQIDTLKNIDDKLKQLEKGIIPEKEIIQESTLAFNEKIRDNDNNEHKLETLEEKIKQNEIKMQSIESMGTVYSKRKTERIYTEEELEELIRD